MRDRVLFIDNGTAMASALAKALERDRIEDGMRFEIRAMEAPWHDGHGMLFTNRKERRSCGSDRKHLKGLRP